MCLLFSTRLPLLERAAFGTDVARASWALPLAGALVGLLGGLVFALAAAVTPLLAAAAVAIASTAVLTGCLHEDGLADLADGLGGTTLARRLEIMRDSRLGTYGVLALVISVLLRVTALASLVEPARGMLALMAAHAAARAMLPGCMWALPAARPDGLAAGAIHVSIASAGAAAILGVLALVLGLGLAAAIVSTVLLLALGALGAAFCLRHLGGRPETLGRSNKSARSQCCWWPPPYRGRPRRELVAIGPQLEIEVGAGCSRPYDRGWTSNRTSLGSCRSAGRQESGLIARLRLASTRRACRRSGRPATPW